METSSGNLTREEISIEIEDYPMCSSDTSDYDSKNEILYKMRSVNKVSIIKAHQNISSAECSTQNSKDDKPYIYQSKLDAIEIVPKACNFIQNDDNVESPSNSDNDVDSLPDISEFTNDGFESPATNLLDFSMSLSTYDSKDLLVTNEGFKNPTTNLLDSSVSLSAYDSKDLLVKKECLVKMKSFTEKQLLGLSSKAKSKTSDTDVGSVGRYVCPSCNSAITRKQVRN